MNPRIEPLDIVDGRTPFQRWLDGDGPRAKPSYVYVASSWENYVQQGVVGALRFAGIECYDYRNPAPGKKGFTWKEINPNYPGELRSPEEWRKALDTDKAAAGFADPHNAMVRADCGVLVLPCGRSAHLDAGWMAGNFKPVFTLASGREFEPELMQLLLGPPSFICMSLMELLGKLGVSDDDDVLEARKG